MKTLLALILLGMSQTSDAIPIYHETPAGATLIPHGTIIGMQRVTVGRYWTWHGKARKHDYVALYSAAPIPEPSIYLMLLVGLGLVVLRANASNEGPALAGGPLD